MRLALLRGSGRRPRRARLGRPRPRRPTRPRAGAPATPTSPRSTTPTPPCSRSRWRASASPRPARRAREFHKGRFSPGGQFPLNTNGGLLSAGHTGVGGGTALLIEGVRQLLHRAEPERQVPERPALHRRRHGRQLHGRADHDVGEGEPMTATASENVHPERRAADRSIRGGARRGQADRATVQRVSGADHVPEVPLPEVLLRRSRMGAGPGRRHAADLHDPPRRSAQFLRRRTALLHRRRPPRRGPPADVPVGSGRGRRLVVLHACDQRVEFRPGGRRGGPGPPGRLVRRYAG